LLLKVEELFVSAKNLIDVPGSIVREYLEAIVISPSISIGLQAFFQTKFSLIIPAGIKLFFAEISERLPSKSTA
jgi:hypothetical protein